MNHIRVGIAGWGTVGRIRHACVDETEGMEVVAISDEQISVPVDSEDEIKRWNSALEMIEAGGLDAVFVCLPNYLAAEVTIAALEAGLHVFCEKPPGRNLADIEAVREVEVARPEQTLVYGFNHRYHDSVLEAMRLIESGDLGEILDLRGVYGKSAIIRFEAGEWRAQRKLAGGGILLDQGIHMVDMMRLFAGEFEDIHAFVSNRFWEHDVEDNAYALMKTQGGVVAMLHSSATQWRHRFQLDITLSAGAISLAGILSSTRSYGAETITVAYPGKGEAGDPMEITTRFNTDESWMREIAAFSESLREGGSPPSGSSYEALRTMELVERIYAADPDWATYIEVLEGSREHRNA